MDINFNAIEVVEAITDYVNRRGISTKNCNVDVTFIKARNGKGEVTAAVSIEPKQEAADIDHDLKTVTDDDVEGSLF